MDQEENKKEIEWLMGSIKRAYAQGKGSATLVLIVSFLLVAIGVIFYAMSYNNGGMEESVLLLLLFLGGYGVISVIDFVFRRKLALAETPQKLLALHDKMWFLNAALWVIIIGGFSFLSPGGLLSRFCLVVSLIILALANWLAMNNQLKLWVGIALMIIESVLLYFAKVDIFMGFAILMILLSVMNGNKTLFNSNSNEEDLDNDIEQDIKQLRELLKKSSF